ncbi:MAG TPA: alpha/beta hydrolase-fold protein [Calditrichia bacterium]|nr:hypothetical protein [Calditrichota bacterium]HQU71092.1 alpha/beta hydrolase-fold protein [Calditrichia bacterium]HQV30247.1 alpha/beta hydrolase-fold protein [Calditrichia bacterium]
MLNFFRKPPIAVTFRVKDTQAEDRDMFIVGNHDKLGSWNPAKVPMDYMGDGIWEKTLVFPQGARLEYKFTRGAWESEAALQSGRSHPNFHLRVLEPEIRSATISYWKDMPAGKKVKDRPEHRITGTVRFHKHLSREGLENRDVIVWLPPGYQQARQKRYPVLYLHDGQNVFDPYTAYTGVEWAADETVTHLLGRDLMEEIIMVGIYNSPDRLEEYSISAKGTLYRRFIVEELKPLIDLNYRTLTDPLNTATIGSSLGGLVSFLLAWEYPAVFGKAACLSPSFIYNKNQAIRMLRQSPAPEAPLQIYMDCGNFGGERLLLKGCRRVMRLLKRKGFVGGVNLMFYHDVHGHHSEVDWAERLWRPLIFLFGRENARQAVLKDRTVVNPTKTRLQKS